MSKTKLFIYLFFFIILSSCKEDNIIYHPNGNVHIEKYDLSDSIKCFNEYFLNGTLKVSGCSKDNKPNGIVKYYYANGQLKDKAEYKSGIINNTRELYLKFK